MKPLFALFAIATLLSGCRTEPTPVSPVPTGPPAPAFSPYGKKIVVTKTIVVDNGQVIDGALPGGKVTYYEPKGLGDGSQREGQKPIFIVKWGAVENVRLGRDADGIHLRPRPGKVARIRNVQVPDVGEDAVTIDGEGKSIVEDSIFALAEDKVGQVNGTGEAIWRNNRFHKAGKCVRTCGTCGDKPFDVEIRGGLATNVGVVLRMTNSKARAKVRDVKVHGGKLLELSGGAKADVD